MPPAKAAPKAPAKRAPAKAKPAAAAKAAPAKAPVKRKPAAKKRAVLSDSDGTADEVRRRLHHLTPALSLLSEFDFIFCGLAVLCAL